MIFNVLKTARQIFFNKKISDVEAENVQDALDDLYKTKQPKITYGTAAPSGGNPGDVYIQIIE